MPIITGKETDSFHRQFYINGKKKTEKTLQGLIASGSAPLSGRESSANIYRYGDSTGMDSTGTISLTNPYEESMY